MLVYVHKLLFFNKLYFQFATSRDKSSEQDIRIWA